MEHAFADHTTCVAFTTAIQGSLCAALFDRRTRRVAAGERLFEPGQPADTLFLLRSGLVKLTAISADGHEIILQIYRPEEIVGELCFCRHVHEHGATALETSEISETTAARIFKLLETQPQLGIELLATVSARLGSAYAELQSSSSDAALSRLGSKLLDLATLENEARTPVELRHEFTHTDLGQMTGARRETISRSMTHLRDLGLIEYSRRGRIRVDIEKLRRFLASVNT